MDKGIYTAVGSINAQRMQETNAIHELANVSTVGFKKAYQIALETYRVDGDGFKHAICRQLRGVVDLSPGSRIATGNAMDIFMNDQAVWCAKRRWPGRLLAEDVSESERRIALVTGELVLDAGTSCRQSIKH